MVSEYYTMTPLLLGSGYIAPLPHCVCVYKEHLFLVTLFKIQTA
jgi:hypothetical protein